MPNDYLLQLCSICTCLRMFKKVWQKGHYGIINDNMQGVTMKLILLTLTLGVLTLGQQQRNDLQMELLKLIQGIKKRQDIRLLSKMPITAVIKSRVSELMGYFYHVYASGGDTTHLIPSKLKGYREMARQVTTKLPDSCSSPTSVPLKKRDAKYDKTFYILGTLAFLAFGCALTSYTVEFPKTHETKHDRCMDTPGCDLNESLANSDELLFLGLIDATLYLIGLFFGALTIAEFMAQPRTNPENGPTDVENPPTE
eukprot:NODE_1087_length_2268_cov_0.218534.p1 type:complete len:255 gc:universal NODE_1087_length_2268_cov_0.218534:2204-1440(-)